MGKVIEVTGLKKNYGSLAAVNGVNFKRHYFRRKFSSGKPYKSSYCFELDCDCAHGFYLPFQIIGRINKE